MKTLLLVPALVAASLIMSSPGHAEDAYAKAHPRIHEVNSRLRVQATRIEHALANNKISATQASALNVEDAAIKSAEQTDKGLDKGHITKADHIALNQELNAVSRQIGGVDHPRVHEVNARLRAQDARINNDEAKTKISAAQAAAFHADDASIKAQEVTDRGLDEGHITLAEKHSLNENISAVGHQIGSAAGHTGMGHASHK